MQLVKRGISQLLQGNIGVVKRGIQRVARDHVPDTAEFATRCSAPRWLTQGGETDVYRITDTEYVGLMPRHCFSVDLPEDLDAIELPISSFDHAAAISITARASSRSEPFHECTLRRDNNYSYPPVMWRVIPIPEDVGEIEIDVEIDAKDPALESLFGPLYRFSGSSKETASTEVGLPGPVPSQDQPPIVLISIDTLRPDCSDQIAPLFDALGEDAVVPAETRTQGTWTPPSHASMLTGTHPGTHGYLGWGGKESDDRPINPDLLTLPELLTETGYKCSGLVSSDFLRPGLGFGSGFHRYHHRNLDWASRSGDVAESVDEVIGWIETDRTVRDHSLFYFLHVFDPHLPYIPPVERMDASDVDFHRSQQYRQAVDDARGEDWDYVDSYRGDYRVDSDLVADMHSWYRKSVSYTAEQIARLVEHLKRTELFEDALIIVTGDHGEEFGERGFFYHSSLYDANIRPLMAIKPPTDADWSVGDEVDTIDFLPTIATQIGIDPPEQCAGTPLQSKTDGEPRITERIYEDWYNVAIERDGMKGIFTYESAYPDRPTGDLVAAGPEITEFYDLGVVRSGSYEEVDQDAETRREFESIAEQFVRQDSPDYAADVATPEASQSTKERLERLGYK